MLQRFSCLAFYSGAMDNDKINLRQRQAPLLQFAGGFDYGEGPSERFMISVVRQTGRLGSRTRDEQPNKRKIDLP